jgi:prevent-host-death family protein
MDSTEITATEAVREFADILDAVEHQSQHFQITRRGRPIALLSPVTDPSGTLRATRPRWPRAGRSRAQDTTEPAGPGSHPDLSEVVGVLRPDPSRRDLLPQLLRDLRALGCTLSIPGGVHRRDYVNVSPTGKRGRILSVNASTGRAEFQSESWDRVHDLSHRFVRLAGGNKAAHPLEGEADADAIIAAAKQELSSR